MRMSKALMIRKIYLSNVVHVASKKLNILMVVSANFHLLLLIRIVFTHVVKVIKN